MKNLKVNLVKGEFQFTFSVTISKENDVVYAEYKKLDIVASSKKENETEAQITAILRLINLMEIKLIKHIQLNACNDLFLKVDDTEKEEIKGYCKLLEQEANDISEEIPIYSETIEKKTKNTYYYYFKQTGTCSDVSQVQSEKIKENSKIKYLPDKQFSCKEISDDFLVISSVQKKAA